MIKRLALLCCILLLPTIAAAQSQKEIPTMEIGGLVVKEVQCLLPTARSPEPPASLPATTSACPTDQPGKGISAWLWTSLGTISTTNPDAYRVDGNQFALAFLGRLQYPLMGDESFTRGRLVPFLMFGPAVVWTSPDRVAIPGPTLGSLLSLAWNISLFRSCPLGRPSVTVMSLGMTSTLRGRQC